MERGEIVETNTDGAIDRVTLDVPLLILEARNFREVPFADLCLRRGTPLRSSQVFFY